MSTVQTPPNQQTGSVAINNDGEVLEEAAGVGPVSNDNNDQADATQVQTSSQGNNNASRGSRPHKPKSKRGKYISKACVRDVKANATGSIRARDVSSIRSTAFMHPQLRQASQLRY
uniref:Uncharacterized protein n=1 Tax=Fusarium oxysporum (strain Fo5176) TaxID=660025 RepID=A0A0D2Y3D0_FUSOF